MLFDYKTEDVFAFADPRKLIEYKPGLATLSMSSFHLLVNLGKARLLSRYPLLVVLCRVYLFGIG